MNKISLYIVIAVVVLSVALYLFKSQDPAVVAIPSTETEVPQVESSNTVVVVIGETASALGVSITPLEILEDSRCPSDVQCIQAGTVRLKAKLESALGTSTDQEFTLMMSMTTEAEEITLTEVDPAPISTESKDNRAYIFRFEIKKR